MVVIAPQVNLGVVDRVQLRVEIEVFTNILRAFGTGKVSEVRIRRQR